MKSLFLILLSFSFVLTQTRSTIYNTGSPDSLDDGYIIDENHSAANKIIINNDYVLEAMVFYVTLESISGTLNVSFREDNNGIPGDLVDDTAQWEHSLDPFNTNGYNLIVTTDQCIYLNADQSYWLTIKASDSVTQATWVYSNLSFYNYALEENNLWISDLGYAGASGVWAEQIYESPHQYGDVNLDFVLNVIDIVNLVGHIMETSILDSEELTYADLNHDGLINVVDVVQLVNTILSESLPSPNFSLEDINPASEYFGNSIGPSFFNDQVSCYYFGKQG